MKIPNSDNIIICKKCNKEFNIETANKTNWVKQTKPVCTYFDPLDIIGSEYAIETSQVKYAICPHCGNLHQYQKEVISLED